MRKIQRKKTCETTFTTEDTVWNYSDETENGNRT